MRLFSDPEKSRIMKMWVGLLAMSVGRTDELDVITTIMSIVIIFVYTLVPFVAFPLPLYVAVFLLLYTLYLSSLPCNKMWLNVTRP